MPSGQVVYSSLARDIGIDVASQPHYLSIVQGRDWAVGDLQLDSTGHPTFTILRSVRDSQGILQGTVIAVVDPDKLGTVLGVRRAGDAAIYLLDRQGRLVYRYPEANTTWEARDWLSMDPTLSRSLAGEESIHPLLAGHGLRRMAARAPVYSLGWVVQASRSEEEVLAPILEGLGRHALLFLLTTLSASLVALFIAWKLVSSLRQLHYQALELSQGKRGGPVSVVGPAEIVDLASAFDTMSEAITARERQLTSAADEQRKLAARLDAIFRASSATLLVYDARGSVVMQNDAAQEMLGYTEESRCGAMEQRIVKPLRTETPVSEPLLPERDPVARALRGEVVQGEVLRLHRPDREVWVSVYAAPILDDQGEVMGAVATAADITPVQQLSEMREDFLRCVSHDLRTPLTVIQGQAQLLLRAVGKEGIDGRFVQSAEAIVSAARRMAITVKDLVDAGRMESQQLVLNRQPVDLALFLARLLNDSRGGLDVDRVDVEIPGTLPPVSVDVDRLERVFTNLLSNALKYSPKETRVLVKAVFSGEEVTVSVVDQGSGIAYEELPHIFDRFYRTGSVGKMEGLGLGLYITRMMVEAHKGRIWVESKLGEGSIFSFTLTRVGDS